jgi:predicted RNA-binding protein associated with RNAse of E/G family
MNKPVILRRRYIPYEVVDISSDELMFRSESLLVTKWTSIKPRPDFHGGISFTFLDRGYKLGRFYDEKNRFLYWYCDIVEVQYDHGADTYTINDLLVDIKILPDGEVRLLDADELAQAIEKGLISNEQVCQALKTLDSLLKLIYNRNFPPAECEGYEY